MAATVSGPKTKTTAKQKVVLDGLNAGKTPKEIAEKQGITVNGVYRHMTKLREMGLLAGKPKSQKRTATKKRRARPSRNRSGGSRNSHTSKNADAIIEAIERAHIEARAQIEEINSEIAGLNDQKQRLADALG